MQVRGVCQFAVVQIEVFQLGQLAQRGHIGDAGVVQIQVPQLAAVSQRCNIFQCRVVVQQQLRQTGAAGQRIDVLQIVIGQIQIGQLFVTG